MSENNGVEKIHEDMDFGDLKPQEVNVRVKGTLYILREASADAARQFQNAIMRGIKMGPDGKPTSADSVADAEAVLVGACLCQTINGRVKTDVANNVVTVGTTFVRQQPYHFQDKLFNKIKEMSPNLIREKKDEKSGDELPEGTVEEVEAKIAQLQLKLLQLKGEAGDGEGDGEGVASSDYEEEAKNLPGSSMASSGSPTS